MGIKKTLSRIASVVVPISTTALSVTPAAPLAPMIPFIVRGLEATLGAKTGATKKALAVNLAIQVAEQLQTAGILPGHLERNDLDKLIEEEVSSMNSEGYEAITRAPDSDIALQIALAAIELSRQIKSGEV